VSEVSLRRAFLRHASMAAARLVLARRPLVAGARTLSVAAGGDAIITRPLRGLAQPAIDSLIMIFQAADAAFFNCEMTFHDVEGYPAATGACGDLNLIADPKIAVDLRWAGFNLTTIANNHTLEFREGNASQSRCAGGRRGCHLGGSRARHPVHWRPAAVTDTAPGRSRPQSATHPARHCWSGHWRGCRAYLVTPAEVVFRLGHHHDDSRWRGGGSTMSSVTHEASSDMYAEE
jgi:hypothetical protein